MTKTERERQIAIRRTGRVRHVRKAKFPEEWRTVPGHPRYEVSDRGRVRFAESKKHIRRHLDDHGYRKVGIDGKSTSVHRIVLLAFIGKCPEGMECRHLNGKPSDNRLKNLRWGTHAENEADKKRHGTSSVKMIRERLGPRPTYKANGCYKRVPHGTKLCVDCHRK